MKLRLRNILLKDFREEVLSKIICEQIEKTENIKSKKVIKIIDYGSGYNPTLIKKIINILSKKHNSTRFKVSCYDFYNNKQLNLMNDNKMGIKFFHIKRLKKINIRFDFCLIIDVLHHIGLEENKKIYRTTKTLKKLSKFIIIKDHFQYGFFSNFILVLMDFVGNYFDGVKIPSVYFTKESYKKFLRTMSLKEIRRIDDKKYYKWYWFYLNSKKLQFISIVK
jgi:hypothetical protein